MSQSCAGVHGKELKISGKELKMSKVGVSGWE